MAQALPQPTMDSLAGVDARLEAIDRLEALVNEVARERVRHRSNIALKRGIQAWRRGDIVKASQWALRATEAVTLPLPFDQPPLEPCANEFLGGANRLRRDARP